MTKLPLSKAASYVVSVWLNCVSVVAMSALVASDIWVSMLVAFCEATLPAASRVDCKTALPLICVTTWSSSVVRFGPSVEEMALVLPEVKSCWSAIKWLGARAGGVLAGNLGGDGQAGGDFTFGR